MVVAAQHDRPDDALAHQLVEFQGDSHPSLGIGVEDARLGADHQFVLAGILDPFEIVAVHGPAVWIKARHGGLIGSCQIFGFAAQTNPAERPIAVIETQRPHDMLDITGENEAVAGVHAIGRDIGRAGIEDRL